MSDLLRTNKVKIVGRLIDADMKPGNRKDNGAGYISGTATVQSTIGGATKEYEISFYANEQTQDKKVSKLYTSYSKMAELKGENFDINFGSQVRSYIFHPYKMVKDHRTGFELGNVDAVMDGELDGFIEAYLKSV